MKYDDIKQFLGPYAAKRESAAVPEGEEESSFKAEKKTEKKVKIRPFTTNFS